MNNNPLWVERYRPTSIDQLILPDEIKQTLQAFVDKKQIPNLIFTGSSGVGKTSAAKAMLDQIDADYIVINGSLNGNIDTLRGIIQQYASSVSLRGGRKYVILDEADFLNPVSTQPALRNFMETFSKNCGFILTCNYPQKILKELRSRCSVVDFKIPKNQIPSIAKQFQLRLEQILDQEKIEYDNNTIAAVVVKFFPDFRRAINELQRYSVVGKIDTGILNSAQQNNFKQLVGFLKEKNFTSTQKWVSENSDIEQNELYTWLYNSARDNVVAGSIPQLVWILAKYQYQSAFAINTEINTVACLAEVMAQVNFK